MWRRVFLLFALLISSYDFPFVLSRKICSVVQFGSYALSSSKDNKRRFKYEVVGVIDPFNKNKILWSRKRRRKKRNFHFFKNLYDTFFCNINDYVYLPYGDQFIFRIFHINLKSTIKYMLKYKIISGKLMKGEKGEKNILYLTETSRLYRFLNNINL
ncbi:conserved Plasmodium protein, unknown function [Plasmodium ovale]|uniref:Fam-a protein n=1 Tax=Plasmodium ovale TaxID=36330 RepID=A0A1D3TI18_PLAOA|nr:conserved Plasmodium protein, unknown function [Plasmodium ovale]